ncbi:MAG: glycogen/starch/alpha-glucan phosphorylase [Clostridiales Family XIII bacterium]|jgi:starch phosphorylase|nr:glycogen/starch/alpha-glucan phosphorylase [Clostridiales Family XIII bacterium]
MEHLTKEEIKEGILQKLRRSFGHDLEDASQDEIYKAVGLTVREFIMDRWADANKAVFEQSAKRLYYLSAEFLMGRALVSNMINLSLLENYRAALGELGLSLSDIEEQEADAGLGNGGLGRLAACFLDALSTLDLPVTGCCIRYEHGLFRQKLDTGEQTEVDDNWLENGSVWEIPRREEKVEVHYGGEVHEVWTAEGLKIEHTNYSSIIAVPYDYPVIGYRSKIPATLRLWSARAKTELDMHYFNRGDYARAVEESALVESVSQILYPEDNHEQGKRLRLKQFYFLSSASMQFLVNRHKKRYGDVRELPEHYTVQINDTHPTVAIPEMIRILTDDEGLSWAEAYKITASMFNYTNHTILSEALERWNEGMFRELLPRIYGIVKEIDRVFRDKIWQKWPGDVARLEEMAIISNGEVRMANLCIAVCGRVNGVSELHGEIIRTRTFRDFYILFPDKFLGITNGVTHRRWLAKANEPLARLIAERIGDGYLKHYAEFDRVSELTSDEGFLAEYAEIRRQNKIRLRDHLYKKQGVEIDPDTAFDTQAKRLHEYKRQLLKLMHIMRLYFLIKRDPTAQVPRTTFLFAAKASPGYYRAKEIIRLILAAARLIDNDPDTKDILKIVFIENYGVSEAEILIPATDISEQLSTAGLEASGTGNMKFMASGAVTIGTLDGANIEIANAVGRDAVFIFGATAGEIERLDTYGNYDPRKVYAQNADIKQVLDSFIDGTMPVPSDRQFGELYGSLLDGNGERADKYYLLHDFDSYDRAWFEMMGVYADRERWMRISALNTARSHIFFADRTISEYNEKIWKMKAIE